MKYYTSILRASLLILCILVPASCAVNPVTGKTQMMLMSESQEITMGAEYDNEMASSFGLYDDAEIQSFVQNKGSEMGKLSHRPTLEYHFRILDSPVVNAFAVPGGYIYLTRGILAQLNNEAELMCVIGHEMGHVTARHSASQQTKSMLGQILLIGGAAVSERFAQFSDYASSGLELISLSFSREDERQADALGIEYATKLGYNAYVMADFFNVLNKMSSAEGSSSIPTFLSTHPNPSDRNASVASNAAKWQAEVGKNDYSVNANQYLKLIDGIVYGEDPRNGFVEGNTFYHPALGFKFTIPTSWQLENAASQISMSPEDGSALLAFMVCSEKTLADAEAAGISGLNLTNTQRQEVSINGLSALSSLSDQTSTNSSTGTTSINKILSFYVELNNSIFVFHGLAPEANFNSIKSTFETSMKSFSKLTDASKLNVKPSKIAVRTVAKTDKLTNILTTMGVSNEKKDEIALLNNLELTDTVEAGRNLKIVTK